MKKWHGYSVNDDMDIHTAVAWDSWCIAWNAGAMAATVGLPEVATCTKSQTSIDWGRVEQAEAQATFEEWLRDKLPSGDVESVQRQWLESSEYANLLNGTGD